jgi:multidrug efflux pump subunit AcrA (membrane-fusion protein)
MIMRPLICPSRIGKNRVAILASHGLLLLAGLTLTAPAFAHGDEVDVSGHARGPVHLTAVQEKTLDVRIATATSRPLGESLELNGEIRLLPERQANVSTRISGQITAVYANLGDAVRAGQRLARVQSRLVGNPPPSVDILAPMTGVIDTLDVSLGQAVEPTSVLYRISDRTQVDAAARVYEEDLGKVHPGQETSVRTIAYPDKVFAGKINLIGPTLDPQSRTVEVRIRLANPDGVLKPNMFARASIALRQNQAALTVPTAAIIEANGEKFVFVARKGEYDRVEIEAGASDGQFTEVTDGLFTGDHVVTQGNREIYTMWLTGGVMKEEDD